MLGSPSPFDNISEFNPEYPTYFINSDMTKDEEKNNKTISKNNLK